MRAARRWPSPTKVDFHFQEPEALADFCTVRELGERPLNLRFFGSSRTQR
jgi:hypothetical protein